MVIYVYTNKINGKKYVGQTVQKLVKRKATHKNKGHALYHAIKKYGEEAFTVEIVDTAVSIEELNQKEIDWIAKLDCVAPKGYNLRLGGNSGGKLSEETKKKIGLIGKGRKHTEEWKQKMRERFSGEKNPMYGKSPNWGRVVSEETREKIRLTQVGKKLSPEMREHLSKQSKLFFSNPDNRKKHIERTIKSNRSRESKIKRALKRGGKPFYCVETKEEFLLLSDAAEKFSVDKRRICAVLKHPNRYKTIKNSKGAFTFRYKQEE